MESLQGDFQVGNSNSINVCRYLRLKCSNENANIKKKTKGWFFSARIKEEMEEEKMRALNSLNAGQSFKQQGKIILEHFVVIWWF